MCVCACVCVGVKSYECEVWNTCPTNKDNGINCMTKEISPRPSQPSNCLLCVCASSNGVPSTSLDGRG